MKSKRFLRGRCFDVSFIVYHLPEHVVLLHVAVSPANTTNDDDKSIKLVENERKVSYLTRKKYKVMP